MSPSKKLYEFIKTYEGFSLKAYPDPGTGGDPITIGYGSTRHLNGKKIKMGEVVTKEVADKMLEWEVNTKATAVKNLLGKTIVNQNQFDALVSFTYNVGVGALEKSTLLKKVKADPQDLSIATEFEKWVRAGGKVMNGLVRRRKAEAKMYFTSTC